MSPAKVGSRVVALPSTTSSIWAEGRVGVIAELRDPKEYSGNDSKNLIRWGDDTILMGFNPNDIEELA